MQWEDIDSDPLLRQRYHREVPLLALNEEIICRHTPDMDRLTRIFGPSVG